MAIGKLIVIGLVLLAALVFALKMFFGYRKGMGKAILNLCCLIIAAVLTFVLASPVSNLVAKIDVSGFGIEIGGQVAATLEDAAVLAAEDAVADTGLGATLMESETFMNAVKKAPVLLVAVVVLPLVFLLLALLLRIVMIFAADPILRLFNKGATPVPNRNSRFAGMGVGFVCALLICGMLLMTPLSLVTLAKPAAEKVNAVKPVYTAVSDSLIVKAFSAIGFDSLGTAYLRSAANYETSTAEGKKTVYLTDEASTLIDLYALMNEHGVINDDLDFNEDGSKKLIADKEFVTSAAEILKGSDVLKDVAPEMISYAVAGDSGTGSAVASLGQLSDEHIDEIMAIYEKLDACGITQAIADEDYDKLNEILNDGHTADELAEAAKNSEAVRAVLSDTVTTVLTKAMVTELSYSEMDSFDLDRFIDLLTKEDVDFLFSQPQSSVVIALIDNADLNEYFVSYDFDAEELDRPVVKKVLSSLITQFSIDTDEIFLLAKAAREARLNNG